MSIIIENNKLNKIVWEKTFYLNRFDKSFKYKYPFNYGLYKYQNNYFIYKPLKLEKWRIEDYLK